MNDIFKLCDVVRQTAYDIHVYLGHGHSEKVYVNALAHRLKKQGILVMREFQSEVFDEDGELLGVFFSDLLIDGCLIIEVKAANETNEEHIAQLLGYLRSSNVKHGMLINFGTYRFYARKFAFTRTHDKPEITM